MKEIKDIMGLFKALGMEMPEELEKKSKIADVVSKTIKKDVIDILTDKHMSNDSELRHDYTAVMATVCILLERGKLILKTSKKG